MAVLISIREGVLVLLKQISHLVCLYFLKSSLDVDLVIHEKFHLIGVVNLIKAADLPPKVKDVLYSASDHLFLTAADQRLVGQSGDEQSRPQFH